jgi:hypothetical protein
VLQKSWSMCSVVGIVCVCVRYRLDSSGFEFQQELFSITSTESGAPTQGSIQMVPGILAAEVKHSCMKLTNVRISVFIPCTGTVFYANIQTIFVSEPRLELSYSFNT